ncbi:PspC domain-containing protein [Pseudonocardia humida]|uniref:PspC domain-containing protein n=1 Tax=Pseudonocardia humida TaxID=2800819 RepID=A0ABT0ZWK0_9PSEU|nr:PspC domain-containing protein [Pseudonocardia humida]MCO1655055.1 PspC domain-containing protein [Pseudonocardia humida]
MEPVTGIHPSIDPILNPATDATSDTTTATAPAPRRRFELRRSRKDRMLSGVCGGVAEALGADPALVRLGLVALTVLGAGSGALLYIAAWILVPEADA